MVNKGLQLHEIPAMLNQFPLIGRWEMCQLEILLFNYLLIEAIMFVLCELREQTGE